MLNKAQILRIKELSSKAAHVDTELDTVTKLGVSRILVHGSGDCITSMDKEALLEVTDLVAKLLRKVRDTCENDIKGIVSAS